MHASPEVCLKACTAQHHHPWSKKFRVLDHTCIAQSLHSLVPLADTAATNLNSMPALVGSFLKATAELQYTSITVTYPDFFGPCVNSRRCKEISLTVQALCDCSRLAFKSPTATCRQAPAREPNW